MNREEFIVNLRCKILMNGLAESIKDYIHIEDAINWIAMDYNGSVWAYQYEPNMVSSGIWELPSSKMNEDLTIDEGCWELGEYEFRGSQEHWEDCCVTMKELFSND